MVSCTFVVTIGSSVPTMKVIVPGELGLYTVTGRTHEDFSFS